MVKLAKIAIMTGIIEFPHGARGGKSGKKSFFSKCSKITQILFLGSYGPSDGLFPHIELKKAEKSSKNRPITGKRAESTSPFYWAYRAENPQKSIFSK